MEAFIGAITGLVVAGIGFVGAYWRMRYDKEKWLKERRLAAWSNSLEPIVARRLETCGPLFEVLGAVRDRDVPPGHHARLVKSAEEIGDVGNRVLAMLYGDAGLTLSWEMRNVLLLLAESCWSFERDPGAMKSEFLIRVFFQARRQLRADLGIPDTEDAVPEWLRQLRAELKDIDS